MLRILNKINVCKLPARPSSRSTYRLMSSRTNNEFCDRGHSSLTTNCIHKQQLEKSTDTNIFSNMNHTLVSNDLNLKLEHTIQQLERDNREIKEELNEIKYKLDYVFGFVFVTAIGVFVF